LFASAISRLCSVLTAGRHVCDIGILFPSTTVQAGLMFDSESVEGCSAHELYLGLVGKMLWYDVEPGILDLERRDFDVLDEDSIQRGRAQDAKLLTADEAY